MKCLRRGIFMNTFINYGWMQTQTCRALIDKIVLKPVEELSLFMLFNFLVF